MVIASWALFGLLALLWSGGAFLAAEAAQWGAQALASGAAAEGARTVAQLPVPQWIALWLDPAGVQAVQGMLLWGLEVFAGALPMLGAAAGWLPALVWMLWALGLAALLVAAVGAHLLVRRFVQPRLASA